MIKYFNLKKIRTFQIIFSTIGFAIATYLTIDWRFDSSFLEYPIFSLMFLFLLISALLIEKK